MAKKKKNQVYGTTPTGFSTKRSNVAAQQETVHSVRYTERKKTVLVIVAVLLLLAIIIGVGVSLIISITGNTRFEYLNENLANYVSISRDDYTNIPIEAIVAEYSDEALQQKINKALVENKSTTPKWKGLGVVDEPITLGDVAYIYYRGYTVDENGKQHDFEGGSNFGNTEETVLEIGSGSFILGFEAALLGVIPKELTKFEKINSGEVLAGDVVYVTYSAAYPDGSDKTVSAERVDLSRTDLDAIYGEGFEAAIVGKEIGEDVASFTSKYDGGDIAFMDVSIDFVTRCESAPCTIDVSFPADYSAEDLRGAAVKFDVYVSKIIQYDVPELTAEFITDTLGISEQTLAGYEGDGIVEKYTEMLKAEVLEDVDDANFGIIGEIMWKHLKEKAVIKKYPKSVVDSFYNQYYNEIYAKYYDNQNMFTSFDAAAIYYLGLQSGDSWQDELTEIAEEQVAENLIFYYIVKKEGFLPPQDQFDALYNDMVDREFEGYLTNHKSELEGLTDEEYEREVAELKEAMISYYGKYVFEELVYLEYGTEQMVKNLCTVIG